jgi:hypothetical protein
MRGAVLLLGLLAAGCVQSPTRMAETTLALSPQHDVLPFVEMYQGKPSDAWTVQLDSCDPVDRRAAAEALGKFNFLLLDAEARAGSRLVLALKDADPQVRCQAAASLGKWGMEAQAAVPALLEALDDSDSRVAQRAAEALDEVDKTGELRQVHRQLRVGMPLAAARDTLEMMDFLGEPQITVNAGDSYLFYQRSKSTGRFKTDFCRVSMLCRDGKVTSVEASALEYERNPVREWLERFLPAGYLHGGFLDSCEITQ